MDRVPWRCATWGSTVDTSGDRGEQMFSVLMGLVISSWIVVKVSRDHSVIQQTLMEPLMKMAMKGAQHGSALVPVF